jgi:hypothetical protein
LCHYDEVMFVLPVVSDHTSKINRDFLEKNSYLEKIRED